MTFVAPFLPHSVEHDGYILWSYQLSGLCKALDGGMHFSHDGSESLMMCRLWSTKNCTKPHKLLTFDGNHVWCDHQTHVHSQQRCACRRQTSHRCYCMMGICGLGHTSTKGRLEDTHNTSNIVQKTMRALFTFLPILEQTDHIIRSWDMLRSWRGSASCLSHRQMCFPDHLHACFHHQTSLSFTLEHWGSHQCSK